MSSEVGYQACQNHDKGNLTGYLAPGMLGSVTSNIEKYRMGLVGIKEVRWEGNGILELGTYTLE